MESLELIDNYFKGLLNPEETRRFEQKILADPLFAEEVAFYSNTLQAAQQEVIEEKKRHFREIYLNNNNPHHKTRAGIVRRMRPFIAAAAIVSALVAGWYLFMKPASLPLLADQYIQEHFQTMPILMSGDSNNLQTGKRLYNDGNFAGALKEFEKAVQSDTSSSEAKKSAGIVSLRLKDYDKALFYFTQLENMVLEANPGKFYHALTLLERKQPGDRQTAKALLQAVDQDKLEEHKTARKWLDNW